MSIVERLGGFSCCKDTNNIDNAIFLASKIMQEWNSLAYLYLVKLNQSLKSYFASQTKWYFYHTTTTYTPSILHLTLIRCNSLTISTLLSVRCDQCHLHATYTPHTLPHDTNTGWRHYGIGEQKSLLLRQISLRPYAV